jgi:ComF family protein
MNPPPFARARACFVYQDEPGSAERNEAAAGRRAILAWKYRADHLIGAALLSLARGRLERHAPRFDLVIPVPLHRSRLRRRGFDQAALLARAVSSRMGRFAPGILRRTRATPTQSRLSRQTRRTNVVAAFVATRSTALAGRSVLLVDDVFTSGATADSCSEALIAAGAARVEVLTLARATRRTFA